MSTHSGQGKKVWAFAAGHIPLNSTGNEPSFTSHDKIAILNTSSADAEIMLTIHFERGEPMQMNPIKIAAKRIRKIRFNDLINPFPLELDVPFAFVAYSNVNVIIQFSRANTSQKEVAMFCVTPFGQSNV